MSIPADSPALDLDACARELIHLPGAIQPHGVLLAVREPGLLCTQASANTDSLLGRPASEFVGVSLAASLGPAVQARIESTLAAGDPREVSPFRLEVGGHPCDALLHRHDGVLMIELEPASDGGAAAVFAHHHRRLQGALAAMRAAPDLPALYPIIARTVAGLSGFERVMVYRFDVDWHGAGCRFLPGSALPRSGHPGASPCPL